VGLLGFFNLYRAQIHSEIETESTLNLLNNKGRLSVKYSDYLNAQ